MSDTSQTSQGFDVRALRKRKVVDTATAETLGRVGGVHIDPSGPRVTSIALRGRRGGRIPFDAIINVGPDAITVPGAAVVAEDPDPNPSDGDAVGSRLLDAGGHELGKVEDLHVDASGAITSITSDRGTHTGRLRGIGSYAVVVDRA